MAIPSAIAVHPHTRGANGICRWVMMYAERFIPTRVGPMAAWTIWISPDSGSSPHAWGQWRQQARYWPRTRVHPHTRGANAGYANGARRKRAGSSPYAWGQCVRYRFSCAHVSVHPHTRGANVLQLEATQHHHGSSPHAWGQWPYPMGSVAFARFIPTRVGPMQATNVCRQLFRFIPTRVGPMKRLEKAGWILGGSSPHACGQWR